MVELLKTIKPTRLITHWPEDWHPDHVGTAELVDESVKRLGNSSGLKTVYYFCTPGKEKDQPNFDPEHFVDISDPSELSFVLWARAIHRSQMTYNTQTSYLRQYKRFGREGGNGVRGRLRCACSLDQKVGQAGGGYI